MSNKFKALTYMGQYVDTSLLYKGIYIKGTPTLEAENETINTIAERWEKYDSSKDKESSKNAIENLKKCKLIVVWLIENYHKDVIDTALSIYLYDAENALLNGKNLNQLQTFALNLAVREANEVLNYLTPNKKGI